MAEPGELPRVVRRTESRAQAEEWAYVLTALGILHELRDEPGGVSVAVLPEDAPAAEAALAAHDAERSRPAPRPQPEYGRSFLWLAYAALLGSFHLATGPRDERVVWFARGSSDAEAFLRGEWWRAVTALAVRRGYVSVGASTAVFAALGALALLQAVARRRMALLALGAGSALLGLLGTGQNADLFAHLFGFAAGGALGAAAAWLARRPPRRTILQPLLALAALAALTACWKLALRG